MKKFFFLAVTLAFTLTACSDDSSNPSESPITNESSSSTTVEKPQRNVVPVDYSKGRTMNKRLGKGINLGNSWDSKSYGPEIPDEPYNYGYNDDLDAGWGNPIQDDDFAFLKKTGFNSVRIPVRWQHNSNPETHQVNPERLAGVLEDVQLAIDAGLVVILDFHWYKEIMEAANSGDPEKYKAEKEHFLAIWKEVAAAMEIFPDTMLVHEIMNEPTIASAELLNDALNSAYEVIRKEAPGKTIMFESNQSSKFGTLNLLNLPEDGNIIFSGHYYEPYPYSHSGHGYDCKGDATYANTMTSDFKKYTDMAKSLYPDVNGIDYIPMNMGEFGISGSTGPCSGDKAPSDAKKALWTKNAIDAAESYGMSWHYWGFVRVGGFEAYTRNKGWHLGFPGVFGL